jgi:hypothetical protein
MRIPLRAWRDVVRDAVKMIGLSRLDSSDSATRANRAARPRKLRVPPAFACGNVLPALGFRRHTKRFTPARRKLFERRLESLEPRQLLAVVTAIWNNPTDGYFMTAANWTLSNKQVHVPLNGSDLYNVEFNPNPSGPHIVTLQPQGTAAFGSSNSLTLDGANVTFQTAQGAPQKYNLTNAIDVGVGINRPATLNLQQSVLSSETAHVGKGNGSNGTVTVNGNGSELETSRLIIGTGTDASQTVSGMVRAVKGGTVRVSNSITIGATVGANGQLVIDGKSDDDAYTSSLVASGPNETNENTQVVVGKNGNGVLDVIYGRHRDDRWVADAWPA